MIDKNERFFHVPEKCLNSLARTGNYFPQRKKMGFTDTARQRSNKNSSFHIFTSPTERDPVVNYPDLVPLKRNKYAINSGQ